jgi:uncharacterized membrane protein
MNRTGTKPLAIGMGAYVALLVGAVAVLNMVPHPALPLLVLLAVLPPMAAIAGVMGQRREIRAQDGVERLVLTEATSLAFYSTVTTALGYGFLEAWAGAPHLSMWWVWVYAMAAWGVSSTWLTRSYR